MRGIRTVHHASESTNTPHESSSDLTEEDASNPSNFWGLPLNKLHHRGV